MHVKSIGLITLSILIISLIAPLSMASTSSWSKSTEQSKETNYSIVLLRTIEKCENLLKRLGLPDDSEEWRILNEIKDLYAQLVDAEKYNDYATAKEIFKEAMEKARELIKKLAPMDEEDPVEQLEHVIEILEKAIDETQKLIDRSLEKNIINETLAEQLREELGNAEAKLDELKEYLNNLKNNNTEWDPEYVKATIHEIWNIIKDIRRTIFEETSKITFERLKERAKTLINAAENLLTQLREKEKFFREKNLTRIADKIEVLVTRLENEINSLKQILENPSAEPAELLRQMERLSITIYSIHITLSILIDFSDEAARIADRINIVLSRLNDAISIIEEKIKQQDIEEGLKNKLLEILNLDQKLVNNLKDLVYAAASGNRARFVEIINEINETRMLIRDKIDEIKNTISDPTSLRTLIFLQIKIAELTQDIVKESSYMLINVERSQKAVSHKMSKALTIIMNKLEVVIKISKSIKCTSCRELSKYLDKTYNDLYAAKQYIINNDFEKAQNKLEDALNSLQTAIEKIHENKR
ncbi:MAG: hypothetical protein J7L82_03000, partial [Staphylothermus sp.]|nr:hypothetical protein [Staphylothermus sp.]